MNRNPVTPARPADHLGGALPPDVVVLAPAPPDAVPMRPPAGAWGLVVVAVRTTPAAATPARFVGDAPDHDPAHTDTADLMAGVWLSAPPPVYRHDGDVVVRLHEATDTDDPAVADVEVLAAASGVWNRIDTWRSVGARWPHEIALSVVAHMRLLADAAFNATQWALIAEALPDEVLDDLIATRIIRPVPVRRAPDALAALIDAGRVEIGEQLVLNGHTATIRAGGVLVASGVPDDDGPDTLGVSTVTALANRLTGCTVNGWHLWRRARDGRPLSELRTDPGTR